MSKRDPQLMRELRQALLGRDPQTMEAVCFRFPTSEEGTAAAQHLLDHEMPKDVVAWWLEDLCDLPHDPESEIDEALLLLARVKLDQERGRSG